MSSQTILGNNSAQFQQLQNKIPKNDAFPQVDIKNAI